MISLLYPPRRLHRRRGSLEHLVAYRFRMLQGAGGAVFALSFAIVNDEYPRERSGAAIGAISAGFGVELVGSDIRGIAVRTGARVAAKAGPGEVLASSTVRDLVAGSGLEFEDRGSHELKGVPGEWRLYAVANA
jgi:class 3 adenylate cyclase